MIQSPHITGATTLLSGLGVMQVVPGVWGFTDTQVASDGYVHHSQLPVALAAYATINPVFAAGRFPGYLLRDMVAKVPSMDYAEYTAMAMVCGSPIPGFNSAQARAQVFGGAVWGIVDTYDLHSCFLRFDNMPPSKGDHYNLRPRGIDWGGDWEPIPDQIKALRKAYRGMNTLQQIFVVTIMHLYNQSPDKIYLTGCPTKMLAADAMTILRENDALPAWGNLVTHYAGW